MSCASLPIEQKKNDLSVNDAECRKSKTTVEEAPKAPPPKIPHIIAHAYTIQPGQPNFGGSL